MAVKVTESGRTVSLIVARQSVNGREYPIRQSVVATEGDVYPDDQLSDVVLEFARKGERGLEYVSDSELESEDDGGSEDEGWAGKSKSDLEAEIEKRGLDVQGTGANGNVLKEDLVKALEDDDSDGGQDS